MYSVNVLTKQLKALGIEKNDLLTVHTSLKKIGDVENRGEGIIEALRTAVKNGLLLIPAHTWDSHVFDVKNTKPCTGMRPCLAVNMANEAYEKDDCSIRRSLHPTHSVVAFGANAIE